MVPDTAIVVVGVVVVTEAVVGTDGRIVVLEVVVDADGQFIEFHFATTLTIEVGWYMSD